MSSAFYILLPVGNSLLLPAGCRLDLVRRSTL
jgi:hypothetical protein